MGDDIGRLFLLTLLAATAFCLVGAPLNVILMGHTSGHGSDTVAEPIVVLGAPMVAAPFFANILTSVIDNLSTGFIAFIVLDCFHRTVYFSAAHMQLDERLSAPYAILHASAR